MIFKDFFSFIDAIIRIPPWILFPSLFLCVAVAFSLKKYFWLLQYRRKQILLYLCAAVFAGAAWLSWNNQHPLYELVLVYHRYACAHSSLPDSFLFMTLFYGTFFFLSLYLTVFVENDVLAVVLDGTRYTLRAFNRGWIISGKTGSGKTEGPVMQIIYQLSINLPNWGGLIIDWKRDISDKILSIFRNLGKEDKLVVLRVAPEERLSEGIDMSFKRERMNLLGYPLPHMTYAKLLLDVATSLGQKDNKSFFSTQAQIHIAKGIETLHLLKKINSDDSVMETREILKRAIEGTLVTVDGDDAGEELTPESARKILDFLGRYKSVSLKNLYEINTSIDRIMTLRNLLDVHISDRFELKRGVIDKNARLQAAEIINHYDDYLSQPKDQRGGVITSIQNFLYFFQDKQFAEVFCSEEPDTVSMLDLDKGKVIALDMPNYYEVQRIYIATFLKFLYFNHVGIRYDKGTAHIRKSNNLVLIVDEAQDVVTDCLGLSDRKAAAKIRGAKATMILAMQSYLSPVPVIGKQNTDALLLNLTNKVILCEETADVAEEIAKKLGKVKIMVKSHGVSGSNYSVNFHESNEYLIEPTALTTLKKFECVIVHCDHGWKLGEIKPIDERGRTADWYAALKAEEMANYHPQERIAA